jgi:hypothetical protein
MMQRFLHELAARHGIKAEDLIQAWHERAAIREHLAGFGRLAAELFAVGDVERMYAIGLHCPESLKRWVAGGDRHNPPRQR